ncbi:MAG TPA: LamG-like jellyroll fold domain-containing protein, partial [Verrucomicrobiae bacterium]|nr:LamG-like jellyroll fold domain-containing protein [Verrucomicrobiae bacterium]
QALLPTNNIAHVAGPIGDGDLALQCGGLGQYVVLPRFTNGVANTALTLSPPFSLEIWANSGNTNLGLQPLINEGRNPVQGDAGIGYQTADAGFSFGMYKNYYYFVVYNTNGAFAQPEIDIKPILPNVWYHLVVTFDGNNEIQYSNGVLAASFNITAVNGAGLTYVPDQVSPLTIGVGTEPGGANGGDPSFQGMIDEVAIYNSVLTPTQVSNHFAAATGPNYSQTVLADSPAIYLRLDEPSFTVPAPTTYPVATNYGLIGASANGLYQPGTAPGIAGPPFSGFGSPSHAVAINGFNAGVDIGGGNVPPELNPTNHAPFTVMTWFQGNPADARGRFQDIMGHSDAAWRITMDNVSSGNRFNPGNGPELQFAGVSDAVTNGMLLNDGNWHMAAGVSDGTNDFLYLDGLLVKSGSSVGAITGSLRDVILGGDPQYTMPANRFFDGNIAHAAFFTNALTAAQIQQLYGAAGAPPVVHLQPTNSQSVYFAGTNALLATTVSGGSPLSLQWYQDGTPVSGQTGANLVYTPVLTNNAGSYFLVASNASGMTTSAVVQLVVYGKPVIQQQPTTNVQVFAGFNPTLSVSALGPPPLVYQWTFNGGIINGATNSSFTITNAQTTATYSCIVSNSYGPTEINPVSLMIIPRPTAPYPVAVLGDHPMAYWRLNEPFDQNNPNGGGETAFDYVGAFNGQYVGIVTLSGSQGYNLATDP